MEKNKNEYKHYMNVQDSLWIYIYIYVYTPLQFLHPSGIKIRISRGSRKGPGPQTKIHNTYRNSCVNCMQKSHDNKDILMFSNQNPTNPDHVVKN